MTDIDQLEGLELIKAFAKACGYDAEYQDSRFISIFIKGKFPRPIHSDVNWSELPADLILEQMNKLQIDCIRTTEGTVSADTGRHTASAFGADVATAVARLVCKLAKEKTK